MIQNFSGLYDCVITNLVNVRLSTEALCMWTTFGCTLVCNNWAISGSVGFLRSAGVCKLTVYCFSMVNWLNQIKQHRSNHSLNHFLFYLSFVNVYTETDRFHKTHTHRVTEGRCTSWNLEAAQADLTHNHPHLARQRWWGVWHRGSTWRGSGARNNILERSFFGGGVIGNVFL